MEKPFTEIRLHKAKPPQEFSCQLLYREKAYLVLRYVSPSPAYINHILIPEGSTTIAHYWEDRNYIAWKIKTPNERLKGYLFHICQKVELGDHTITYEDLELDIWYDSYGHLIVLDQEEVDAYGAQGLINPNELFLIEEQKKYILSNCTYIIKNLWSEKGVIT